MRGHHDDHDTDTSKHGPTDQMVQRDHADDDLEGSGPDLLGELGEILKALRVDGHVVDDVSGRLAGAALVRELHRLLVNGRRKTTLDTHARDKGQLEILVDHGCLESSACKHGHRDSGTLDHGLRLYAAVAAVRVHESNEIPKELGLEILGDVVAQLEDGSHGIRSSVGTEHGNPKRRVLAMLALSLPGLVEGRPGRLGGVLLSQAPEIVLGKVLLVAQLHEGRHPRERQEREDRRVFDGAFLLVDECIVRSGAPRPQPFHEEFDDGKTKADGVSGEVWQVLVVELLGDQGPELDGECDEQKQPEEQGDAVRVSLAAVLQPLNSKDDAECDDRAESSPYSEVAKPDTGVVDDLDNQLHNDTKNDGHEKGL